MRSKRPKQKMRCLKLGPCVETPNTADRDTCNKVSCLHHMSGQIRSTKKIRRVK